MKNLDVHAWQKNEEQMRSERGLSPTCNVYVQRPGSDYKGESLDKTGQDEAGVSESKAPDHYSKANDQKVMDDYMSKPAIPRGSIGRACAAKGTTSSGRDQGDAETPPPKTIHVEQEQTRVDLNPAAEEPRSHAL